MSLSYIRLSHLLYVILYVNLKSTYLCHLIQTNAASSRVGTTTAVKKSLVVGLKSERGNEVEHVLLEDLMAKL